MSVEQDWVALNREIIDCRRCPRLVDWREEVARTRRKAYRDWVYWGRPVPGFGDIHASVLVVGLAPGAHGANRTGRMFTGDGSGDFLYGSLHQAGFANQPSAKSIGDGLQLDNLFISAVCRCAPPANKPYPDEIANCMPYLEREFSLLGRVVGIVALGKIAFDHTLRLLRSKGGDIPRLDFSHLAEYRLGDSLPWVIASYHPSRQNTQTGRLTEEMFDQVWALVNVRLTEQDK
jgi:uracil-DNA glycosylase family 4